MTRTIQKDAYYRYQLGATHSDEDQAIVGKVFRVTREVAEPLTEETLDATLEVQFVDTDVDKNLVRVDEVGERVVDSNLLRVGRFYRYQHGEPGQREGSRYKPGLLIRIDKITESTERFIPANTKVIVQTFLAGSPWVSNVDFRVDEVGIEYVRGSQIEGGKFYQYQDSLSNPACNFGDKFVGEVFVVTNLPVQSADLTDPNTLLKGRFIKPGLTEQEHFFIRLDQVGAEVEEPEIQEEDW